MEGLKTVSSRYRYSMVLLRQLVSTDFKLRYQSSALGYIWALVRPLALFAILLTVFGLILKIGSSIPHYPIYLLLGIVLWNFFAEATNNGLQSVVSRGELIRKINFPRYIIVVSGTISALINLAISLVIVFVFLFVAGVHLHLMGLFFPLLIVELYLFALALAFFLAALYVKYRDMNYIWELFLQAAFYATPIIYPMDQVIKRSPELAKIMLLNPVAQIVQDARYVLISNETITLRQLTSHWYVVALPMVAVIVMVVLAALYFRRNSKYFAENV